MWLYTQTFHFLKLTCEKQNNLNRLNAELCILSIVAFISFLFFRETVCTCTGFLLSVSVDSL